MVGRARDGCVSVLRAGVPAGQPPRVPDSPTRRLADSWGLAVRTRCPMARQIRGKRAWRVPDDRVVGQPVVHVGEVGDQVVQEVAGLAAQQPVAEGERGLVGRHPVGLDVHPAEAALEEHPVGGFGEVEFGVLGRAARLPAWVAVELLDDVAQRPREVQHRHPSPGCGQLTVRLGVGEVDVPAEEVVAQCAGRPRGGSRSAGDRGSGGRGSSRCRARADGVTAGRAARAPLPCLRRHCPLPAETPPVHPPGRAGPDYFPGHSGRGGPGRGDPCAAYDHRVDRHRTPVAVTAAAAVAVTAVPPSLRLHRRRQPCHPRCGRAA